MPGSRRPFNLDKQNAAFPNSENNKEIFAQAISHQPADHLALSRTEEGRTNSTTAICGSAFRRPSNDELSKRLSRNGLKAAGTFVSAQGQAHLKAVVSKDNALSLTVSECFRIRKMPRNNASSLLKVRLSGANAERVPPPKSTARLTPGDPRPLKHVRRRIPALYDGPCGNRNSSPCC